MPETRYNPIKCRVLILLRSGQSCIEALLVLRDPQGKLSNKEIKVVQSLNQFPKKCLFAGIAAVASSFAFSAEDGGFSLSIDSELRYDDNIYSSDTYEVDSTVLEVRPELVFAILNNGNAYGARVNVNHAEYFDSSSDSYTDHEFSLFLNHRFNSANAIDASASYARVTEKIGTGFSESSSYLFLDGPDDYDVNTYDFIYHLGRPGATIRLDLSASRSEHDFDSSFVGNTRDYERDTLGATLFYRAGGRTDLFVEYRNGDTSYDNTPLDGFNNAINLDSTEDYYLVGMQWEATAKTTGVVRLGSLSRDQDSGESNDSFHWEAQVSWEPLTYSKWTLATSQSNEESNGPGLFIDTSEYTLAWGHNWTSRISSQIDASFATRDYEEDSRSDDETAYGVKLNYNANHWLDLGLGYRFHSRDSSEVILDYDRNVLFLDGKVTF